jgi:DNA-binding HxlR family transcriptional regulator
MPKKKTADADVLSPCRARELLADLQLADKWTTLILHGLLEQPMRFNELRRKVDGISQKMLAQSLRGLERNGLVTRTVQDTMPVTVEYRLTALGNTLDSVIRAIFSWIVAHEEVLIQAQADYDLRHSGAPRASVHAHGARMRG